MRGTSPLVRLHLNFGLAQDFTTSEAWTRLTLSFNTDLHPPQIWSCATVSRIQDLAIPKNWTHFILRKVRHLAALEISARPRRGHVRNLDLHEIQATSAISLCLRFGQARDLVTYEVWACLTPCLTCDLAAAATRLIRLLAHWRNEPKEDLTHFRTWLHSRFRISETRPPPRSRFPRIPAPFETQTPSRFGRTSDLTSSKVLPGPRTTSLPGSQNSPRPRSVAGHTRLGYICNPTLSGVRPHYRFHTIHGLAPSRHPIHQTFNHAEASRHLRFQPPRYNHTRDLAISENWAGSEYSSISSLAVSQTHGKLDLIPSPLLLNVCAIFLALWIAHFLSFTFSLNQHLLPTQIAWIITPASFSQSSGIDKQHRWYHALCKECNQCTSTLHYCEPSCTEPFLLFSEF